jgi:hypothetical protein
MCLVLSADSYAKFSLSFVRYFVLESESLCDWRSVSQYVCQSQRVRVTLRLRVGQSVCLPESESQSHFATDCQSVSMSARVRESESLCHWRSVSQYVCQSQSHFVTDGQSVSQSVRMSWFRAPSEAHDHKFVNCLTAMVLSYSGALSDERSGLSFVTLCDVLRVFCVVTLLSLTVLKLPRCK